MSILSICLYSLIGVVTAFLTFTCIYQLVSYIEKHIVRRKITSKYQIAFSIGIFMECVVLVAGYFIMI